MGNLWRPGKPASTFQGCCCHLLLDPDLGVENLLVAPPCSWCSADLKALPSSAGSSPPVLSSLSPHPGLSQFKPADILNFRLDALCALLSDFLPLHVLSPWLRTLFLTSLCVSWLMQPQCSCFCLDTVSSRKFSLLSRNCRVLSDST